MNADEITSLGFLIFPDFPMACLTSVIEPLRAANEISGKTAFNWHLISETGTQVTSSARVVFGPTERLDQAAQIDQLFLISGPNARFEDAKAGNAILRKIARHGTPVGAISGGIFPLARSGLLQGHVCSVHWCYAAAFGEEFSHITASDEVIIQQGQRTTVSGAAAAFDLALHLIAGRLGPDVATEVACWFQHPVVRGPGVAQRVPTHRRASADDMLPDAVKTAIAIFGRDMHSPVQIAQVARMVGVSGRQLDRLFGKATGKGPQQYYRSLRMKAARQLVQYSTKSMPEIAAAVGYASATPLRHHYTAEFGVSPQRERDRSDFSRLMSDSKRTNAPH